MTKVLTLPEGTYLSMAECGYCKVCGHHDDLRMGACFVCAGKISGRAIEGGHELWETKNPSNCWRVQAS